MIDDQYAFLADVFLGDEDAISFIALVGKATQIWDDLADEPEEVTTNEVKDAVWVSMCAIPQNRFYRHYYDQLAPLLEQAVLDWMTATDLEKTGEEHDLDIAFVIRDSLIALVSRCAWLIGGYEYAKRRNIEIRRFFHDETLEEYKNEHR